MNAATEEMVFSNGELPDIGIPVLVVCRRFRCLGFLDAEGVWKSHYSNEKLEDVIGWHPLIKPIHRSTQTEAFLNGQTTNKPIL